MRLARVVAAFVLPACLGAQVPAGMSVPFTPRPVPAGPIKVGPSHGTVILMGGGSMGPEVFKAFIDAAGGPDALIVDVPNAAGTDTVPANAGWPWRSNGAKNVVVLFTKDRRVADSDSFVATLKKANGIWFEGGRPFHLVQDYGGTRAEVAFRNVLERGGVIGGTSAGASILGDLLIRGAPSQNNGIMAYPGYEQGFGYLRNVANDQHVVARARLADLADSILPRFPKVLAISEDEGTAWVVRGDTGSIIGRNKAFVYGGNDANDPGAPFLTLHPGDRYDLNSRHMISRAIDRSPVSLDFIKSMFRKYDDPAAGGATVLVARDGDVFIDNAFGVGPQPHFMPRTTLPLFGLGEMTKVFAELCTLIAPEGRGQPVAPDSTGGGGPAPSKLQSCVPRIAQPIGAYQTTVSTADEVESSVDELYRFALLINIPVWPPVKAWTIDTYKGVTRRAAYGTPDGKRAAIVLLPDVHVAIAILTNDAAADARGMSEKILDKLLAPANRTGKHP